MNENDQLEYNDALVYFASMIQKYGSKQVLMDFQTSYPAYFHQLKHDITMFPVKPVAALLKR